MIIKHKIPAQTLEEKYEEETVQNRHKTKHSIAAISNKKKLEASRENRVDDDVNVLVLFVAGRKCGVEGVQAVADGINSLVPARTKLNFGYKIERLFAYTARNTKEMNTVKTVTWT